MFLSKTKPVRSKNKNYCNTISKKFHFSLVVLSKAYSHIVELNCNRVLCWYPSRVASSQARIFTKKLRFFIKSICIWYCLAWRVHNSQINEYRYLIGSIKIGIEHNFLKNILLDLNIKLILKIDSIIQCANWMMRANTTPN